MSLPIISADQRLAETRGVKGVLVGKSGIGKTSQLWTLPPERTLFFDLEAGDLAVEGWAGDTLRPRTWQECRDFAVFIGGANPALRDDQPFSQAHFEAVCARFGDPSVLDKYDTVFVDSITVAGRLCLQWCKGQPQAYSEKTGKPDSRGAYGLMGQEMIAFLTHLQHARGKNVWFVGILDEKLDDFNRRVFSLQIDGSKTGLELPGIVDEVVMGAGGEQEGIEAISQVVVQDRAVLAAQLVLGAVRVVDIVGRIQEGHVCELGTEQALVVGRDGGIATQHLVVTQQPQVTRLGDDTRLRLGDRIVVRQTVAAGVGIGEQRFQGVRVEADQPEIEVRELELTQFEPQQLLVPAGVFGDAVIRNRERPPLGVGEVRKSYHRHLRELEILRGEQPAMAGDDGAVTVDQHRVHEAEFGDACRNLRDLRLGVGARVVRVRRQRLERHAFDGQMHWGLSANLRCEP